MFDNVESWFRTAEDGHVDHAMFTVVDGKHVEIEIGLWREILTALGFQKELLPEELDELHAE